MVSDLITKLADGISYLQEKEAEAYLAGALLGVRLSRALIKGELDGSWNKDLHGVAAATFMGDMRYDGQTREVFLVRLAEGSGGAIRLSEKDCPKPKLMADKGPRYAQGILDAVDIVFSKGTKHFVYGWAYSREEGSNLILQWADDMEREVERRLEPAVWKK